MKYKIHTKFTIVLAMLFLLSSCKNLVENKPELPLSKAAEFLKNNRTSNKEKLQLYRQEGIKDAIKIEDFLPQNFLSDGSEDYTEIIQKVVNENPIVIFPDFSLLINTDGLKAKSNSTWFFQENTLLKYKSNDKKSYYVVLVSDVENFSIYNLKVEGDRYRRIDPSNMEGEWGMGLWIMGSKNINIYYPEIQKCWGDGIYIGSSGSKKVNDSINIIEATINDNRRNGISIITGKNIFINKAFISNTKGTPPQAGIDIEPNNNDEIIENIKLKDIYTGNNLGSGIKVVTYFLYGDLKKNVLIDIENHIDENSYYGFQAVGIAGKKKQNKIQGLITIENATWMNNTEPYSFVNIENTFPLIKLSDINIYEGNKFKPTPFKEVLMNIRLKFSDRLIDLKD
ncbi:right-handed parallel beta-helix repeat-containing protein [Patiriisocius sp. Uisw_017]|jgi:hypothetical protein|uniref:right-handed parallel beta-helix repeat-containing protein n=1 Tax=Patiriisocius sp. Uisw_017 TaxID=3230968 RepID=UPI0039E8F076